MSNLCGDRAQCPVFPPEIKACNSGQKITQKQLSKFSAPVQFCLISLLCSKYFVQDCRLRHGRKYNKFEICHSTVMTMI